MSSLRRCVPRLLPGFPETERYLRVMNDASVNTSHLTDFLLYTAELEAINVSLGIFLFDSYKFLSEMF
jgi:hypothetical protein